MGYKRINIDEANTILKKSDLVIADIRDAISFTNGHINGAININQSNLTPFIQNADKQTNVLVVCYHGNSSQTFAAYLSEYGFQNVYSLDGGYEAWAEYSNID